MDRNSVVDSFIAAIKGLGGFKILKEIDPPLDHIYGYAKPCVFVISEDGDHLIEYPEIFDLDIKIMVVAHRLNDPEGKKTAIFINAYLDDLVIILRDVVYSPSNHLLPQVRRSGGSKPVFSNDPTMRLGVINITAPMYIG